MQLSPDDITAIFLSLKLAGTVTFLLLLLCTPLAWWLAHSTSILKPIISAFVALPLVLPPTVLGFYFLIIAGPSGPLGSLTEALGLGLLPFTYWGLVVASLFYSLPFVVQPLQNAFEIQGRRPMEIAATLGARPIDGFFSVMLPLCRPAYITAATLGFAHTLGEFGLILMMGGNIPGETRVVSVQIYNHVEALEYGNAHSLAALMLGFSLLILLLLYSFQGRKLIGFKS
ncbi:molybdate ABC transporter permease subunit [Spongiibacter sp. KMU-158]|uniref:Molybdenum transport system permease n=1 Tax=Spongiibacter pelagi TaxID=2760804 RepID=A0A927C3D8_9GAMM|nr:molybdate ABC transporter permease subunit [Spongiibacter pelagi]MBD2859267.1 molybdate ABC transporter permease subunit [Spongiibacter pelagi]